MPGHTLPDHPAAPRGPARPHRHPHSGYVHAPLALSAAFPVMRGASGGSSVATTRLVEVLGWLLGLRLGGDASARLLAEAPLGFLTSPSSRFNDEAKQKKSGTASLIVEPTGPAVASLHLQDATFSPCLFVAGRMMMCTTVRARYEKFISVALLEFAGRLFRV